MTHKEIYVERINRVIDYIEANLYADLQLSELAHIAHFSPYHFHRIFRSIVNETLFQFVQRLRIERAAVHLVRYPAKSVTEIALSSGFSGSASFVKAFKSRYNISPTSWRKCKGQLEKSKTSLIVGREGEGSSISSNGKHTVTPKSISIETLAGYHVAYIRHVGPYANDTQLFQTLFGKLFKWAAQEQLPVDDNVKTLSLYHDEPSITLSDRLRLSVCLSIPAEVKVSGEIGKTFISGGKYVVARFEISRSEDFDAAWHCVMGDWFPGSGYQPDDKPAYEICYQSPHGDLPEAHLIDICVPIVAI